MASASSYIKTCNYYDCPRVLFTGSPARLDGKPLSLADSMVIGVSVKELIEQGKISDFSYYAPQLDVDLSKVKKSCGDYNSQDLENAMSGKKIYGDILKYYKKLANGKQAIAYCINVSHSQEICELFNNAGFEARHIDSHTSEDEREKVLQDFKDGKFKILCNCGLISEGITLPTCEVCLMLRATCSLALFIQQRNESINSSRR